MSRAVGRLAQWIDSSLLPQASYQATLAAAIILPQSLEVFPRRYRAFVAATESARNSSFGNSMEMTHRFSSAEARQGCPATEAPGRENGWQLQRQRVGE